MGHLSGVLIDEANDMPCSSAYATRFGSLPRAYTMIGWDSGRDYRYLEINRQIRVRHGGIIQQICARLEANGAHVSQDPKTDLLTINYEYGASLVIARCRESNAGNHRWLV